MCTLLNESRSFISFIVLSIIKRGYRKFHSAKRYRDKGSNSCNVIKGDHIFTTGEYFHAPLHVE